jgi:hypothetical protein
MPYDIVRLLKIENPNEGGTQTDWGPTEIDPTEDFATAKGYIFEDNQAIRLEQISGRLNLTDQDIAYVELREIANPKHDQTLYVSNSGNDLIVNGSIVRPYQTIAAAVAVATGQYVIYILPGVYTEPTITLSNDLTLVGGGFGNTEIQNGFSYTAAASENTSLTFRDLNTGTITFDGSAAANGTFMLRECTTVLDRTDTNQNVLMSIIGGIVGGGTVEGGTNTANETLFVSSVTLNDGLLVAENSKVVARFEIADNAILRTLDCSLFGAAEYVRGSVNTSTPTWQTDYPTLYFGDYIGTLTKTILLPTDAAALFPYDDTQVPGVEWGTNLQAALDGAKQNFINITWVNSVSDLPAPVSGVITLAANATYFFTANVDLNGSRIVCGNNTTILGASSENCSIFSTGLSAGTALITSVYSLPMRNITITHGTALNLNASGTPTAAIDWIGVNFTNCAIVGTIANYSNFIMSDCALLSSANMTFDGTFGTIGGLQCLFSGIAAQTTMIYPATLTVTRRIRWAYCSWVAFGGGTALNVSASAVIPTETYILDTCNFSGGGTYTAGVDYTSNTAFFSGCRGISNSAQIGQMFFTNNATQNPIATTGVFEKILGTTSPSAVNQKFTHTSNRLTYSGGLTRTFVVTASTSANSVVTNTVVILVRLAKNGTTIAESESQASTSANGRNENFYSQAIVELAPGDFIELFISNATNANNLLATELNVLIVSAGL